MVYSSCVRRSAFVFLFASVVLHAGLGGGVLLASRAQNGENREPRPVFVGETFDIQSTEERPARSPELAALPPATTDEQAGVTSRSRSRSDAPSARPHLATQGNGAASAIESPLDFGAMGDRSATSPIVAVARAFPQAASTDPLWRDVPFGAAGDATLEIDLEQDGTLARWSLGAGASPALRQGIVRTMALIGARSFVARGAVTKLRLSVRVSADAVRDGTDAVYAIHSEHEGDHASAFFSLSSGRRIDLVIIPEK